jgi:hypothetical protein
VSQNFVGEVKLLFPKAFAPAKWPHRKGHAFRIISVHNNVRLKSALRNA